MAEVTRRDLLVRAREARRLIERGEAAEGRARVEALIGILACDDELLKKGLKPMLEDGGEAFVAEFNRALEATELWKVRKRSASIQAEGLAFTLNLETELEALRGRLAADPADPDAARRLAAALAQAEAQKDIEGETAALGLMARHGLADASQRERAIRLLIRGRQGEAVELLRSILATNPDDIGAWRLLGDVYASQKDLAGQAEALGEVVRLDEGDTAARLRLSAVLTGAGRSADAVEHLMRLIELEPDEEAHWTRLARTYASAGDAEGEIRVQHQMLERGLTHLVDRPRLMRMLVARDRDAEAVVQLKAIVAAAPDDVAHWRRLARTQADLGDVEGEVEALLGILQWDEVGAAARSRLARLLTLTGRPAEALEQLTRLAELEPDDASHWRRLAEARAAAGDVAGEKEALARADGLDECGVDFRGEPLRPY